MAYRNFQKQFVPVPQIYGQCPWTSKNPKLVCINGYLRDGLMQSVLGISFADAFSLIWGNVGISYYSLLHLAREKRVRNDTVKY